MLHVQGSAANSSIRCLVGNSSASNGAITWIHASGDVKGIFMKSYGSGTATSGLITTNVNVLESDTNTQLLIGCSAAVPTILYNGGTAAVNERMRINAIGVSNTNIDLTGSTVNNNCGLRLTNYKNSGSGNNVLLARGANGSLASPTSIASGDNVFFFGAQGYSTVGTPGFYYVGAMYSESDGAATATTVPGRWRFETSSAASILLEAMRIDSSQNVGIGTTAPTARVHISQTITATGALKGLIVAGVIHTNQTLSTEISNVTITNTGRQWATGAITTQREVVVSQPTYSFVGASTVTDAATLAIVGAPVAGTNATLTNTAALWVQAGITRLDGDLKFTTAGGGVYIKEGTNAMLGIATLVLGTATVSTTKVTANSRIFLGVESLGTIASPVAIAVTARNVGTDFTITSANLTDTSVISWIIIEPI